MRITRKGRLLSWLLVLAMVLTMLPTMAFATETAQWTKVDLADIQPTDTIAITMTTSDGTTYVLYNANGASSAPNAVVGTVSGSTLTTEGSDTLSWNIASTEDGYVIYKAGTTDTWLYSNNANNGVRVGSNSDNVWVVDEASGYLKHVATSRYLGVYTTNPDWRAYTVTTGNIVNQTLGFWKFTGTTVEPDPEPVDPDPVDPEPVEPLFADGDHVVIYNPANLKALSSVYTGNYNTGVDVTVTDGVLAGYTKAEIWTVGVNENGTYTFSTLDGKKLSMGASYSSTPLDDVNTAWNVTDAATEGCYYIQNAVRGNYLEWYKDKNDWSSYSMINDESLFAQKICKVELVQYAKLTDTLADGDQFVIYYNSGSLVMTDTVSGTGLAGTAATPEGEFVKVTDEMAVLTASVDEDGNYTFTSEDGKYLTSGATGNSLTLADEASEYSLWTISPVTGGVHIVSVNAAYNGNAQALEIYNSVFTTFTEKTTDYYLFNLYKLTDEEPVAGGSLPANGAQVVIYNASAEGVIGLEDDLNVSMSCVPATVEGGVATVENGGRVFTVTVEGNEYTFASGGKYLATDESEALYLAETESDYTKWTLTEGTDGYVIYNKAAKYNTSSVCIEYFSGSFSGWTYKSASASIFEFQFYPVAEGTTVVDGIVNKPTVEFGTLYDAYVGADYTFTFTVDAVFGVDTLTVTLGEETVEYTQANGTYTVTIPAEKVTGDSLEITVTGTDTKGTAIAGTAKVTVKDEPVISGLTPASGSQTGEEKRPTISADIDNAGENPTVVVTLNGETVDAVYADGKVTYTPAEDLADGRVTVTVTVTRTDGKTASKSWSFTVGVATEQLYFGQLHSHTQYSDGAGTLDTALEYIASLPESANVQFVAFTDHSNYFDTTSAANPEEALYDMSLASEASQALWEEYTSKAAAFNASQSDVIALAGFEMTWSGGPGHINTWCTPGIVSRNNTTLNNKTNDAGMKAYYALLSQTEGVDSISQFNHPGSTFGTFTDFAYWDAVIDTRIYLVEVGNGEGAIGAGGYYPSYEYYTMALDKGWHVAPTNNQDNHKGKWGNANDARDVILTDDFSEEGLYQAIRELKVYATEDKNLEIYYTVNDLPLGTIIEEVPEELNIHVQVYDPDASDSISKVEVIVNSGKTAYTWDNPADLAAGDLSCTLDPAYSYYYIRVTEGDGDLAVTAPVWVGETLKLGISSVESGTDIPVTGEELEIVTTLFNSEATDATVKYVAYTINGAEVIGSDTTEYELAAASTSTISFNYTPTEAKVVTITVTVCMDLEGVEYVYTMDITLDVLDASKLVYIGIDASHQNEYVAGNYFDSMGNFSQLAAEYSVRTVQLNTSEDLLAACANAEGKYKMIILTAPSRRNGTALRDPYDTYSEEEIAALVAFNKAGGTLVLAGWSDNYESYTTFPAEDHMAAQQNKVLEALGSSLRIGDDAANDDVLNGGQTPRLYLSTYNWDSFLMTGVEYDPEHPNDVMYTERFSQYGGATIYVVDGEGNPTTTVTDTVTPVVYGHASTYSKDADDDGLGGDSIPKYEVAEGDSRVMILATEQLEGQGLIVVSGAAFMSNFEVQATIADSNAEKNYSNYKICENLVQYINPVQITDIAEVQAQTEVGYKYTIEGVVTSNASGYDKDTAFFDCIYIQDGTAGICCFPVAGDYKIGDVVRISGTTDFYQGEMELQVTSITKVDEATPVEPTEVTAGQINDSSMIGTLVTVKGTVVAYDLAEGLVQTILVADESGKVARVFIDGYITTQQDVQNLTLGAAVTATGIASYDNTFTGNPNRIRIRNRADIVCTPAESCNGGEGCPSLAFSDLNVTQYYHEAVDHMILTGLMEGNGDGTFTPNDDLTRGQIVTILYRLEGCPDTTGLEISFTDVQPGKFYTEAVAWAYSVGLITGRTNEIFDPEAALTRQEMVAILYRYAAYKGVTLDASGSLDAFTDSGLIHSYAVEPITWAVTNGIVNGTSATTLEPRSTASRCQFATVLYRFLKLMAET